MLAGIVRNHVRGLLRNADIFRIQFTELAKLTGERADILREKMSLYVHRIADIIEAGQRDGTFAEIPPMTQALLILGMCNGTTEWYRAGSPLSIDEVADYAAQMALWGAKGAAQLHRKD
jgi:hypothetical protein